MQKNRWLKYRFFALFRLTIRGQSEEGRKTLDHTKTHLGRNPEVCSVCTIDCSQAMLAGAARARRGRGRSPEPQPAVRGVLVDTSVYLKPAELVDVALDVLARLAPCLNLGVGELGHKDLLDTIGADNCRK